MNKIQAAGIAGIVWSLWIAVIFLTPKPYLDIIYNLIAAGAVGWWIGQFYLYLTFGSRRSRDEQFFDEEFEKFKQRVDTYVETMRTEEIEAIGEKWAKEDKDKSALH